MARKVTIIKTPSDTAPAPVKEVRFDYCQEVYYAEPDRLRILPVRIMGMRVNVRIDNNRPIRELKPFEVTYEVELCGKWWQGPGKGFEVKGECLFAVGEEQELAWYMQTRLKEFLRTAEEEFANAKARVDMVRNYVDSLKEGIRIPRDFF